MSDMNYIDKLEAKTKEFEGKPKEFETKAKEFEDKQRRLFIPPSGVINLDDRKLFAIRWWDGYCETFEVTEVRMGAYLIWMKLTSGEERRVPLLSNVRWAGFVKSELKL